MKASRETTPVFGLTKGELWPIVEEAAGTAVASFDVLMEHQRPEPYGFSAEKGIPTFDYVTETGRMGSVTVFVKRFHRTGPAESQQYRFLQAHQAPIPRMYGALLGADEREILFLEYVDTSREARSIRAVDRLLEFVALMARFHAIRPSPEYKAWLEQQAGRFADAVASAGPALELIWDHARKCELGRDLKDFCSSAGPVGLRKLQSLVRQVMDRSQRMPQGLIHTDFSTENTGRRQTGEVVVLDIEWVKLGPWCFDVAELLGTPPEHWRRDLSQGELARHYLEEYARWGGSPPPLEVFVDDIGILWKADIFRYLDWDLGRALGGSAESPADDDECRACCDHLHRTLAMLLAHHC